jgi:sec-independent protein translocase protein TatB
MFDVSFTELMVIGVVALIVIGPERLPKVARTVGHLLGRAQRYVNDVKSDIQREIELDGIRKLKTEMEEAAQSMQHNMHSSLRDTEASLREPAQALRDEMREAAQIATATVSAGAATPALADAQPAGPSLSATMEAVAESEAAAATGAPPSNPVAASVFPAVAGPRMAAPAAAPTRTDSAS